MNGSSSSQRSLSSTGRPVTSHWKRCVAGLLLVRLMLDSAKASSVAWSVSLQFERSLVTGNPVSSMARLALVLKEALRLTTCGVSAPSVQGGGAEAALPGAGIEAVEVAGVVPVLGRDGGQPEQLAGGVRCGHGSGYDAVY